MIPNPDSSSSSHSQLSTEELLLIKEQESLTKAVEILTLRRQAVAAARLKAEAEARVQTEAERAGRVAEQEIQSAEAERRLQAERAALDLVSEDLRRRRARLEAARTPTSTESRGLEAVTASTALPRPIAEPAGGPRQKTAEPLSSVAPDKRRMVAAPIAPESAADERPEQLTLEQRVRGEIEGMAAAQRMRIDAARAQLAAPGNSSRAQQGSSAA